ncbi:MAG: sigma 54-interacting transcriptional regulator [Pirellulaceae bacterium]
MLAYLVIREGAKWSDVFRLIPGRKFTVGRASTNHIVVKNERCSRNHAELFQSQDRWVLRDLGSRNGTIVNKQRVTGDYSLAPGDIVRIAECQMAFVFDISKAFADSQEQEPESDEETVKNIRKSRETQSLDQVAEAVEPTQIMHRRGESTLCRLAFDLAKQEDESTIASRAIDCLLSETAGTAAGLWLVPDVEDDSTNDVTDLKLVSSAALDSGGYFRISEFLATTVLGDGEAILARNVADDSVLSARDSAGLIHATSVIVAPIRHDDRVAGVVHLYSTRVERNLEPEDLEFSLAVAENVALALRNLDRQQELAEDLFEKQREIADLRSQLGAECQIIGSSAPLMRVQQEILRVAPSKATVLIRGESGVGKEMVARAMHFGSPRCDGPFVCLNCAALTETLLESELFGHERGAFTGATERKIGKFEAAHHGTLMLDEIGEMTPSTQAKFLRVLEGHPFERVGGSKSVQVDVRVIAATNRDLEKAVTDGLFRRDLYFRLNVVEIQVPPLRKRPDDVVELANFFLGRFIRETGRRIDGFAPDAIQQMRRYHWPGNVRELKNVVERAVVLGQSDRITCDDLSLSNLKTSSESGEITMLASPNTYAPRSLSDVEKQHIVATLEATGWNKSRSAIILGIERSTLDRKIKRYDLKPDAS